MHESESSSSHSVLESKSSHKSLNLAHESDSSTTTLSRSMYSAEDILPKNDFGYTAPFIILNQYCGEKGETMLSKNTWMCA